MAKAKKLPSGQWRTLVYDYTGPDGKRHYASFSAETKKESEYMAAEFAMNKKGKKNQCNKTFGEALDEYIKNRSVVLSPTTIREYKRLRNNNMKALMNIKISNITQELVQEVINEESETHSAKSVRNMHGLISSVIKLFRPDFSLHTALPQRTKPKIYVPTDNEIQKLLRYVKDGELEIPILLAAFGPMRRSEICALDSTDIVGNIVHVSKAMVLKSNKEWVIKQPKSFAGNRDIMFPPFVMDKLKNIPDRIVNINPNQITDKFAKVLKETNIPHFRFHDLRHYSASVQHAMGIPDAYIMARGGWGSDATLKNVYRHTMVDKEEEMNNIANTHFEKLMNNATRNATQK